MAVRACFAVPAFLAAAVFVPIGPALPAEESTAARAQAIAARIVIPGPDEPGAPLVVSGTIYAPDGRTPLEGMTLHVYHTDAKGLYSEDDARKPDGRPASRLAGTMRTDAAGRYEFRTIRPGSYPGSRVPAHIHARIEGPGYPQAWIEDYVFEDDPYLPESIRSRHAAEGSFSPVLKPIRGDDGVMRGARDIRVRTP
ncbi:MAG TPA: protocatechuate 3,4-dioxygenase [Candidatus Polarisedimenticolia bacterium]|nr:protocatechuate 3,4-dioxygenase [Candidatus Polarisedimenticolia bacterium]